MEIREEVRENWGTRAGFVLAAVGSAVGLGNLWGFPYKLYSYGGGAFLIPYVLAMLLVGLPLLIMEFSLGHMSQRAAPDALRRVNRRSEFVGWWQILLSFVIITYYAVVLAWCVSFLWFSIKGIFAGGELPWAGHGLEGVEKAKSFFGETYLAAHDSPALGAIRWPIVAALAITWLGMYLCVFRGVKLVSRIVLWTVPLPWLMLLVLTIRGLTLDGATRGLEYFLEPNWQQLAKPETWRWAFGQTFFSLSLAFGVMITYSSFLHRKSDLNNNAAIIGLADLGTSFVAGIAVFATIGGMALASELAGAPVPVDQVVKSGPGLAFVAFPYALAQLPYSAWFSTVFFVALLTLGIDSAFSITESVIAGVVDKTGWSRRWVVGGVHLLGFGLGLIYCTQGGLNWLDTMDTFINGPFGIALLGLIECIVVGWLFRIRRLREHANERSDWRLGAWWSVLIRTVIPVVLAALIVWSLYDNLTSPSGYIRRYQAGPVTVSLPARPADAAPEAVLQVQFARAGIGESDRVGEPVLTATVTPPVGQYAATELPPATALTVRARWTADPKGDAPWATIGSVTTNRRAVGWNVPNLVGVIIFALAPVLGVVIMLVRFKSGPDHETGGADTRPRQGGSAGLLGLLLALAALGLAAWAFVPTLQVDRMHRLAQQPPTQLLDNAIYLLAGAVATALLALAVSGVTVLRAERGSGRPARSAQFGGMFSTLAFGAAAGLALAMFTIVRPIKAQPLVYNTTLSKPAYVMLAVGLAIILGGLAWCFYRAIKAAGADAEMQMPEE